MARIDMAREAATALLVWGLVPAILLHASVTDWRERRIANEASALLLAGFAALCALCALPPSVVLVALGCGLIAFVFGFALFALGQMGAGDVKLLGALVPWLALSSSVLSFAVHVALAGGALSVAFLALRAVRRRRANGAARAPLPDAPAPTRPTPVAILVPIGAVLALAFVLGGPGPRWAVALAALVSPLPALAGPLAPLTLGLLAALAMSIVFLVLERMGAAPALAVPDAGAGVGAGVGADAAPAPAGAIETPYGLAIAAGGLLALPSLSMLSAL